VYDAFEDLVARAHNYQPDATVLGVQVQAQVDTDAGVEPIVGTNRDPQFGPLVLFGLGGIFVEVMGSLLADHADMDALTGEATDGSGDAD
jgi:acetyltransferase